MLGQDNPAMDQKWVPILNLLDNLPEQINPFDQ